MDRKLLERLARETYEGMSADLLAMYYRTVVGEAHAELLLGL
jgi:hypothetical protein